MKYIIFLLNTLLVQTSFGQDTALIEFNKQITSAKIIALGESGHGFETFNHVKSELILLLQREMGFNTLAFESSITLSAIAFLSHKEDRMRAFLYPFWNTPSVRSAADKFAVTETDKPRVIGFDIQEDCRYTLLSEYLTDKNYLKDTRSDLLKADSILNYYIGKDFSRKSALTPNEYALLIRYYENVRGEIGNVLAGQEKLLIDHCIQNRIWLCSFLTRHTVTEKMDLRDSLMAENVRWMHKELYNSDKMIIWAGNVHIANKVGGSGAEWMGERLSKLYGKEYFSVSLEKGIRRKPFAFPGSSIQFYDGGNYDAVIYIVKLQKVKSGEWVTPCDVQ